MEKKETQPPVITIEPIFMMGVWSNSGLNMPIKRIKGATIKRRFNIGAVGRLPKESKTAGKRKNGKSPVISYLAKEVTAIIKPRVASSLTQGLSR
jgi:hypothetical protein